MAEKKRMPVWLIVVIVFAVLAVFGMILNATGYKSKSQLEQEQAATEQPAEEEPAPEPEPEQEEQAEQKLSASEESAAYRTISKYGEQVYPYGFKLHYLIGVQAERQMAENVWFFKIKCDVTNEYGATAKDQTCDATLQRDGDSWTVTDFMVY